MLISGLQSIVKTTLEITFPKCSEVRSENEMKKTSG